MLAEQRRRPMDRARAFCESRHAGEFIEMEQTKARGLFVDMDHPVIGKYKQFGPVPRLMETPGGIFRPAPLLGEHNQEIYGGDLGMNSDDLVALQAEGVI